MSSPFDWGVLSVITGLERAEVAMRGRRIVEKCMMDILMELELR